MLLRSPGSFDTAAIIDRPSDTGDNASLPRMSSPDEERADALPRHGWTVPLVLLAALAVVHTWPLAVHPATLSSNDNADAQLNEWILAWVQHALVHAPFHVFQANIFYPANDSLAFSEPLIVPAMIGAPIAWFGGSPVLVFNLLTIVGLTLSALASYALIFAWTGNRIAALLAGSVFAFNTHTLTRLPHMQALHIYGLPLVLLAVDRLVSTGRTRDAWLIALWLTILAYTSGYLLVFGTVLVGVAMIARVRDWLPRTRTVGSRFALASLIAIVAIAPLSVPYQRAANEQGMVRSLAAVTEYSATPAGYLAASSRLHLATWSRPFFSDPVNSFFPGFAVITLAMVGLLTVRRLDGPSRQRVTMLAAIAVVGFVLSLGTHTPVYGWLYRLFPPMHGLRVAARFGNLFLLGTAGLAGFGLAYVHRTLASRGASTSYVPIAAAAFVILANVESLRAPIQYQRFTGIPPLYGSLATEPRVVLAEVPFYPRQATFENAEYVLNSTAHWRPLMNGYSGYTPSSYVKLADAFWYFPRDYAIEAMRRAGVTHVMVHPERFGNEAEDVIRALNARADFELMGVGTRGLRLYRLR